MARARLSLDFKGFLDYAEQLDKLGREYLKKAVENSLTKSAEYCNKEVDNALKNSQYAFDKGEQSNRGVGGIAKPTGGKNRRAKGRAVESAKKVASTPLEWEGNTAKIPVGVSWYDAPEVTLLAFGTPHIKADHNLQNAIKVKGKYRKEASRIQQEEFIKVLKEAEQ